VVKKNQLAQIAMMGCFAIGGFTSSDSVLASNENSINATVVYGTDNNPHSLSSALDPTLQNYAEGEFKVRTNYKHTFYFYAKANKTVYFDDDRADQFKTSATMALKHDFKIFKRKFDYKFSMDHRTKDKTYVNKVTGLVATFGGVSIADRYDSTQNNYGAQLSYKPYRYLKYILDYEQKNKAYQEYEIAGLSNFDYGQQKVDLTMEYQSSQLGRFFLEGQFKQREYVDKRGKDLDGVDIFGTDLIYNYSTFNLGYVYRPSNSIRWKYTFNYEERRDTTTGYYNATSGFLSISAIHQLGDYHFLTTRAKYSKFSLINQLDEVVGTIEEDGKEKYGFTAMIGYEWILATLFDTNLAVYIDLEHRNFENSDPFYTYERSKAAIGIRWSGF
jgi:hypothetical protein